MQGGAGTKVYFYMCKSEKFIMCFIGKMKGLLQCNGFEL